MLISRRHFNQLLLGVLSASLFTPAFADLIEGRDWRRIEPSQPTDTAGKIEVLEFFAYACPHCSDLNRLLTPWTKQLPNDVAFRRIPVTFGRSAWSGLAKLFFTLESSGDLDRFDQAVFDALHKQRLKLFTTDAITEWVDKQGLNVDAFTAAFESFDIQTKLSRSEQLVSRYQIDAVPTLIVAGRYIVLGNDAKTQADLLTIADGLIAKVRQEGISSL
ncbi:twin-arginine translocation pathway signal protein [Chromatium weissei]|nr:twin-arginine translocation pathway signal protein [Chromatium weissei]